MRASKNIVLLWTKGCMDRFLDDGDSGQGDFVRREYSLALRLGQNIVPFCTFSFLHCVCFRNYVEVSTAVFSISTMISRASPSDNYFVRIFASFVSFAHNNQTRKTLFFLRRSDSRWKCVACCRRMRFHLSLPIESRHLTS